MEWHGPRAEAAAREGAALGLLLGAEHVLQEANMRVPLLEGTLERSGVPSVDEARLTAAVSYDTVYAVYQHERLDLRHAPGRTAKYLEVPLNASRETVAAIIAAQIRRALA
jgi:hypothetical protein